MTQEEHLFLTALGYITLYPEAHSEGVFTFTDHFLTQLATVFTNASGTTTKPLSLVNKLEELHLMTVPSSCALSPRLREHSQTVLLS